MAIRQLLIHKHEVYLLDYMLDLYKRLGGNPFKVFGWVMDDAKRGDNYQLTDAYNETGNVRETVVGRAFLEEVEKLELEKSRKRRQRG